ncbi:MAG: hypothetical protein NXH95_12025 [Pseudomonadaceae bacterium]|nr:hypothetical protein [Pseudomonadaceae bacterium]
MAQEDKDDQPIEFDISISNEANPSAMVSAMSEAQMLAEDRAAEDQVRQQTQLENAKTDAAMQRVERDTSVNTTHMQQQQAVTLDEQTQASVEADVAQEKREQEAFATEEAANQREAAIEAQAEQARLDQERAEQERLEREREEQEREEREREEQERAEAEAVADDAGDY